MSNYPTGPVRRPKPNGSMPREYARDFRRAPARNPGSWRPAGPLSPMNANKAAAGLGLKGIAARLIPIVGIIYLLGELHDILFGKGNSTTPPSGSHFTNTGSHVDNGFHRLSSTTFAGHTHTNVADVGLVSGATPNTFNLHATLQTYVLVEHVCGNHPASSPGTRTFLHRCDIYPPGQSSVSYHRNTFRRPMPVPRPRGWPWEPQIVPWFDPSLPYPYAPIPPPLRPSPRRSPDRRKNPDPREVPWRRVDPRRNPDRRKNPDPRKDLPPWPVVRPVPWSPPVHIPPNPNPNPNPRPRPNPTPRPRPDTEGALPPGWQWAWNNQRSGPRLRQHARLNPRRSGKNEKEKKVGMKAAGFGWALGAMNFATEARDAVEAISKAMPCDIQRQMRGMSAADKSQVIWANWDKLDPEAALSELILNQFEDMLIGRSHALVSKVFGTEEEWKNYLDMLNAMKANEQAQQDFGQGVNAVLDMVAESLGLKRVQCGRK